MYGWFIYLDFERVIIYEIDATPQKRIYEIPKAMDVNLIIRFFNDTSIKQDESYNCQ